MILRWKKTSGNRDRNNIVKGMRSGRNAKTANSEKSREVNTGYRPKNKLCHIEWIDRVEPPTEEVNMVVRAKQGRRNEDRKHNGIGVCEL